ncbi:hypothetical protein [Idiomarina sp.]|uniref:hypothetical protein n=1 Tax=Idiomarina sp. TaxID=1874361 RepID=UPI003A9372C4
MHLVELGQLEFLASVEQANFLVYQQMANTKIGSGIAKGQAQIKLDLEDAKHILTKGRSNIVHAEIVDGLFRNWDFDLPNGNKPPFHGITDWKPRKITTPLKMPTFAFLEPRLGKSHQGGRFDKARSSIQKNDEYKNEKITALNGFEALLGHLGAANKKVEFNGKMLSLNECCVTGSVIENLEPGGDKSEIPSTVSNLSEIDALRASGATVDLLNELLLRVALSLPRITLPEVWNAIRSDYKKSESIFDTEDIIIDISASELCWRSASLEHNYVQRDSLANRLTKVKKAAVLFKTK